MTSNIQQARDVLAKWRENGTSGRWEATIDGYVVLPTAPISSFVDVGAREEVAPLIVGTAGNPDLLDAIDWFFLFFEALRESNDDYPIGVAMAAGKLATTIIAADERMS